MGLSYLLCFAHKCSHISMILITEITPSQHVRYIHIILRKGYGSGD